MKKRVLIIEDDQAVRENIITLLSEEGYNVLSAKDGETGIKIAENEKPDLIICDIIMKGITGYNVLENLSKNDNTKSIPFIFLTAKTEIEHMRLGMQLGADDYILKPFKSDELLKSISIRLKKVNIYKKEQKISVDNSLIEKYSIDDRIFAKVEGNPVLLKINEILFINAENQYSSVRMLDGKTHVIRKSLSNWESSLPPKYFLRIHRGTIINTNYLLRIEKWYNTSLLAYLKDIKEPFVISKRYSTKIRKSFI
jgi:DNA-binding LytR/AlgR family response regulator